jgi:hypothetical protein
VCQEISVVKEGSVDRYNNSDDFKTNLLAQERNTLASDSRPQRAAAAQSPLANRLRRLNLRDYSSSVTSATYRARKRSYLKRTKYGRKGADKEYLRLFFDRATQQCSIRGLVISSTWLSEQLVGIEDDAEADTGISSRP